MPPNETAFLTVRELGARLRRREFTAIALTEFFLERLERLGPRFNAVVRTTRAGALAQAAEADRELAAGRDRGPLHGIPYGAKDLFATRGVPTSWGCAPFRERILDEDATAVRKLREAGAVLVAKLAMVEIAGGLGYRQADAAFTGPGLNPWNADFWCGGSSSGSGTAVAAGLVPFALGTETWGSIITPASFCGISGLRPTYGRVSRAGAMALSWSMDKIGPLARTAEDCGLILQALAGADPLDPSAVARPFVWPGVDESRPRLAVINGCYDRVHPDVAETFQASLKLLAEYADVVELEMPGGLPWNAVPTTIIDCEMAAAFEGMVVSGEVWELAAPEDRWGAHAVQAIPAVDYIQALRLRQTRFQPLIDELVKPFDAIVTPARATTAYRADRPFRESSRGYYISDFDGGANACGLPAISIPNGFGADGLPTGLMFTARAFEETRMLAVAAEYQRRSEWHRQHPPL